MAESNVVELSFKEQREEKGPKLSQFFAAKQNNTLMQAMVAGREKQTVEEKTHWTLKLNLTDGVRGMMPFEFSGADDPSELLDFLGKTIMYKVKTIDKDSMIVVCDRVAAMEQMKNIAIRRLEEGEVRRAKVDFVTNYNLYINVDGIETKVKKERLFPHYVDLREEYQSGDELEVIIAEVDKDAKQVRVEPLIPDPFEKVGIEFNVGNDYLGTITNVIDSGIFIEIEPRLAIFTKFPDFWRYRMPKKGDRVIVRLSRIDAETKRLYGIFKQFV